MKPMWNPLLGVAILGFAIALAPSAHAHKPGPDNDSAPASSSAVALQTVDSANHFNAIVRESGAMPLIFEFYADWCRPCRILEPLLMELAREFANRFRVYRVDVDTLPSVAETLGLRSVPYVVFFHDGRKVHSIKGLQPKATYRQVMQRISGAPDGSDPPDGTDTVK